MLPLDEFALPVEERRDFVVQYLSFNQLTADDRFQLAIEIGNLAFVALAQLVLCGEGRDRQVVLEQEVGPAGEGATNRENCEGDSRDD